MIASQTDHGAALDGMVEASDWAATGSGTHSEVPDPAAPIGSENEKTPV